jgi:hypothetical protein
VLSHGSAPGASQLLYSHRPLTQSCEEAQDVAVHPFWHMVPRHPMFTQMAPASQLLSAVHWVKAATPHPTVGGCDVAQTIHWPT